jgi:hypothetical protein
MQHIVCERVARDTRYESGFAVEEGDVAYKFRRHKHGRRGVAICENIPASGKKTFGEGDVKVV